VHAISGWMAVGFASVAMASAQPRNDPLAPLSQPVQRTVRAQSTTPLPPTSMARPAALAPQNAFETYKARLAGLARAGGVRETTIQSNVYPLRLNSRVMELDRAQPGAINNPNATPPFAPYRRSHVTANLIQRGQSRYSSQYPRLQQVYARYGVDPAVLMAIYGHETSYGAVTGSFDLVEALASLAYEGRRRSFFEDEFVAALKLIDMGVPRYRLKGSWAGATGYPQFMPTVVLRLRTDGDGDGYADVWASELDGLASIANYLRDAGWKAGVPWGIAVRTPPTLNRAAIRSNVTAPRCPRVYARHSRWLSIRDWRALGVVPIGRGLPDSELATLIEPDGPYATAYLLTNNYRTILDYNCSNFYALSVGLLADAIAQR
jgi:membrane-bound lytic murein transglycosylase B